MTDNEIVAEILSREGGFVNHPADKGGPTNFGITQATLSMVRGRPVSEQDVREMSREDAEAIYLTMFVAPWRFVPDGELRHVLVDWAVNSGPAAPTRALQEAVGADVDGVVGPQTIFRTQHADPVEVRRKVLRARLDFYLQLAFDKQVREFLQEHPTTQLHFLRGWIRQRVLPFV